MRWNYDLEDWNPVDHGYQIRSSVLGGAIVTEADGTGRKYQTYVYAAGAVVARQRAFSETGQAQESVVWEHRDAGDTAVKHTDTAGAQAFGTGIESSAYDALGGMTGSPLLSNPPPSESNKGPNVPSPFYEASVDLYYAANRCQVMVDNVLQNCSTVSKWAVGSDVRNGDKVHLAKADDRLPGSPLRFYIPGSVRDVEDRPDGVDEEGNPLFHVDTAETPGFWVMLGSWDLSWEPQQQRARRIAGRETHQMRNLLNSVLDNAQSPNGVNCRDFLNDVLRRLGVLGEDRPYKDIMDVFSVYASKLGLYDKPGSTGWTPRPAASANPYLEVDLNKTDWPLTFLHELLHGAGITESFNHIEIGSKAYEAAVAFGFMSEREFYEGDPEKLNSPRGDIRFNEEAKVEKPYFDALNDALKAACGGNKGGESK